MIDKAARTTMDIFLVNVLSEEVMKNGCYGAFWTYSKSDKYNLHFNIIFQIS